MDSLVKTIRQKLPEITDRKIRNKWELIVDNSVKGIFNLSPSPNQDDSNASSPNQALGAQRTINSARPPTS